MVENTTIGGSLTIKTGEGADVLQFTNASTVFSTAIDAGSGDDSLQIGDVTVGNSLAINMDATSDTGNDTVTIAVAGIGGSLTANLGNGDNVFQLGLTGDGTTTIAGNLQVTMGAGNDSVALASLKVTNSVLLTTGAGNTTWDLDQNFFVGRDLSITATGAGDDSLVLFSDTVGVVGGNITLNLGDGTNSLVFNGTAGTASGGTFRYTGGTGTDSILLNGRLGRQLVVNLGAGNDTFEYGTTFTVQPPLSVYSAVLDGSGGNDTYINNVTAYPTAALNARTTRLRFEA
jgi:hypothetical protein